MQSVFILNPKSARGKTAKNFQGVLSLAKTLFPNMTLLESNAPLHASALAKEASQNGASLVVAVGGDGTLNEVVNGLIDSNGNLINKNCHLGFIMNGTGTDFRRSFGFCKNMRRELVRLSKSNSRFIDVGRVSNVSIEGQAQSRYFINIASVGISAKTVTFLEKSPLKFGKLSYLWAAAHSLMDYRACDIEAVFDGEKQRYSDLSLLTFANGQYFGGGMHIAPTASLDDGVLNAVSVCKMNLAFYLRHGLKVFSGKHLSLDRVSSRTFKHAEIKQGKEQLLLELDGEFFGSLPAKVEILPGLLPVRL